MEFQTAQLKTADAALGFIFGGKSTFTFRSLKTGEHISFKVTKAKEGDAYFVKARKNGDAGEGGFNYAGWMKQGDTAVRVSAKSQETTATARAALNWGLSKLTTGEMPEQLEVHHEGRCCRCNRQLTDPVSIERGIGPECLNKMTGSKVIN